MLHVGYKLSSEEFDPTDLIRQAARAETAGFDFALISDHFHPWIDRQGQSPFVWAALGGIAGATERLVVGTGVTTFVERTVCWARSEREARRTAHEIWALAALEGALFTELAQPEHFAAAFKPITEDQVAEAVVCGPDPARHLAEIRRAERAGYDHVCLHQVGPDQEGFMRFYETEILPRLRRGAAPRRTQLPRRRAA